MTSADSSARLLELLKTEQQKLAVIHDKHVPILFKVAPDLTEPQIADLAKAFLDGGLDGLIATNTTLDREKVADHKWANEAGGLSGKPVLEKSNHTLAAFAAAFSQTRRAMRRVGSVGSSAGAAPPSDVRGSSLS